MRHRSSLRRRKRRAWCRRRASVDATVVVDATTWNIIRSAGIVASGIGSARCTVRSSVVLAANVPQNSLARCRRRKRFPIRGKQRLAHRCVGVRRGPALWHPIKGRHNARIAPCPLHREKLNLRPPITRRLLRLVRCALLGARRKPRRKKHGARNGVLVAKRVWVDRDWLYLKRRRFSRQWMAASRRFSPPKRRSKI